MARALVGREDCTATAPTGLGSVSGVKRRQASNWAADMPLLFEIGLMISHPVCSLYRFQVLGAGFGQGMLPNAAQKKRQKNQLRKKILCVAP